MRTDTRQGLGMRCPLMFWGLKLEIAAPGTAFNLGCCVTRVEPIQAIAKSVQRHFPFCFKLLEFKHKLL